MALPIRKGAIHKVVLGPAVAVADGFTPVTTVALTGGGASDEAEVILHDDGTVVDISAYTWAAIATADGYYHLTLQTGITNTVGHMTVVINDDDLCLPITKDFVVMDTGAYDTLYAASATILTSADIGLMYESVITTSTTEQELIMATAFPVDDSWIGCECSLEDVSAGVFYSGNVWISDAIQSTETLDLSNAFPVAIEDGVDKLRIYARQHATYALNTYDAATRAENTADKDEVLASVATAQTDLNIITGATGVNLLTATQASIDAIETDTGTTLNGIVSEILVDTAVIGSATDTDIATDIANVQTAADAIKAKTDSLTFTKASEIDANIQSVDDVTIGESGTGDQDFGEV